MNSFISNFEPEARVLLFVAAVVLLCEGALRASAGRLSADVKHIRQIPALAAQMARARGERVLLLGNSLTREGVKIAHVRSALECGDGRPVFCEIAYPDDTAVLDWYYLFRHYFSGRSAPDYLVLGYVKDHLADSETVHADRIAAYFGGWSNASEMLSTDLHTLNGRMDYLLSSALRVFSERERVRLRVLSIVAPDILQAAQRLNEAERMRVGADEAGKRPTYTRLERLLELCARRKVRAVFVAMPQPTPSYVDPELPVVLARHGGQFLDMRYTPGLTKEDYADGFHMNPRGAAIYSQALGRKLRALMGPCDAPPGLPRARVSRQAGRP